MTNTLYELDEVALRARYDFFCRATRADSADPTDRQLTDAVKNLERMIESHLVQIANKGSPDDFADIYLGFNQALEHFREFCAFPTLAQKNIVAFGGAFSAGKSSLINALLGAKLLPAEVDPTTNLPAYVLKGEADAIYALNQHRLRISLHEDELASLTHDEIPRYGSQIARLLGAAFVLRQAFPWDNLAFIDTPGYSNTDRSATTRADADLSLEQLRAAQAIVWVVSAKQGNISESDLAFLADIDPAVPRIVVVSHADQVSESDRDAIVQRITDTLVSRNLPAHAVLPVSARPRYAKLLAPLQAILSEWNASPREQRIAHHFKALFVRYARGLETEQRQLQWQMHRIKHLLDLGQGAFLETVRELKTRLDEQIAVFHGAEIQLADLRKEFFTELKQIGERVGIRLPEPEEIELLDMARSNLLEHLIALRSRRGHDTPESEKSLHLLMQPGRVHARPQLPKINTFPLTELCKSSASDGGLAGGIERPIRQLQLLGQAGTISASLGSRESLASAIERVTALFADSKATLGSREHIVHAPIGLTAAGEIQRLPSKMSNLADTLRSLMK